MTLISDRVFLRRWFDPPGSTDNKHHKQIYIETTSIVNI